MSSKYKHIKMVCPNCGKECNVVMSALWLGDVFLHWNAEDKQVDYDLADSTLDYETCDLVCDRCGEALFNDFEELEDYLSKKEEQNG